MRYREILPSSPLQSLVRFFWVLEVDHTNQIPCFYQLFAEGLPGLAFFDNTLTGVINGPSNQYKRFAIKGGFKMVGVFLYPAAIQLLFQKPITDITNKQIDLSLFLGKEGIELQERIWEQQQSEEQIRTISDFLLQRMTKVKSVPHKSLACVHQMVTQPTSSSIETLAFQSGLSKRQFERNHKSLTGFSPKLFTRLMRFQTSLRLAKQDHQTLTSIGYQAGYADQSHFIREFRELSGISPKAYFNLSAHHRADTFIALPETVGASMSHLSNS